jgi:hypothetical protein
MIGDMRFVAGVNIQVAGWGKFDGKYFIEKAAHSVNASGYITSLDLRLDGPKKGKKIKYGPLNSGSEVYGGQKKNSEGERLKAGGSD